MKIFNKLKNKNKLDKSLEKLIPPKKNNWNWGDAPGDYKSEFSAKFVNYFFPYLLKNARNLGVNIESIRLLDIGCGWAPMAIPFLMFNKSSEHNSRYLGIDIRKDAIDWLSSAYADFPNVSFQWHQAASAADYIEAASGNLNTYLSSDGQEANYELPLDFSPNIQWSSSVFTHLTPEACLEALKIISKSCDLDSIQANTWLIIDSESTYAMSAGIADRLLTLDRGDFLTYSEGNPLVCTAYKLKAIKRMYEEAGLEIVNIERGSWRGPFYHNSLCHYQDMILSKKSQKP